MLFQISFHIKKCYVNDKDDKPQWKTHYLKSEINWRNNIFQEYQSKRNRRADDFIFLENVIYEVSELVFSGKMATINNSHKN